MAVVATHKTTAAAHASHAANAASVADPASGDPAAALFAADIFSNLLAQQLEAGQSAATNVLDSKLKPALVADDVNKDADLAALDEQLQLMLAAGQPADAAQAAAQVVTQSAAQAPVIVAGQSANLAKDGAALQQVGEAVVGKRQTVAVGTADVAATARVKGSGEEEPSQSPDAKDFSSNMQSALGMNKPEDVVPHALPVSASKHGLAVENALTAKAGDVPSTSAPIVQQSAPQQPTVVSTAPGVVTIQQPVGSSEWGAGLGDKVVWMVGQQQQSVELHLNPPALGPLEVRLEMSDGQANLSFMTEHAPVREAIESATGRLRDMLGDSGISMGSVSVNVGSFTQQQQQQAQAQAQNQDTSRHSAAMLWQSDTEKGGVAGGAENAARALVRTLHSNGVVDTFA